MQWRFLSQGARRRAQTQRTLRRGVLTCSTSNEGSSNVWVLSTLSIKTFHGRTHVHHNLCCVKIKQCSYTQ